MKRIVTTVLFLAFLVPQISAQRYLATRRQAPPKQLSEDQLLDSLRPYYKTAFYTDGETVMPYRILWPHNYDSTKQYPFILFLHGAGERGKDNERQLIHGGSLFLDEYTRQQYPAIVAFPQCPTDSYWSNVDITTEGDTKVFNFKPDGEPTKAMALAMGLTKQLLESGSIKKDQVYVMGLSMGGMGTFEIVRRMPATFAAALPICGGADTSTARQMRKTAWWVFHGAKDDVVPPHFSNDMVNEFYRVYGMEVRYTVYDESKHDSWNMVFKEPGLMDWIFKQRLKPAD